MRYICIQFILVCPDCPMMQCWYEFTCTYLWNGMFSGRMQCSKHHKNGSWGEKCCRLGNALVVKLGTIRPPKIFVSENSYLYKQWGLCFHQECPQRDGAYHRCKLVFKQCSYLDRAEGGLTMSEPIWLLSLFSSRAEGLSGLYGLGAVPFPFLFCILWDCSKYHYGLCVIWTWLWHGRPNN